MKIIACCSSETYALPSIYMLEQLGFLTAVCVPENRSGDLTPKLNSFLASDKIRVLDRDNLEDELIQLQAAHQADALVSITFPWYISEKTTESFPKGCWNVHFSLLPKYGGQDPVFWQLKNGDNVSGYTVHQMTAVADSGSVLLQKEVRIIPGEHYGLLCLRLSQQLAADMERIVEAIENPKLSPAVAADKTHWKKPTEQDRTIQWESQTAEEIQQLVNACNPNYGGALTFFQQDMLGIFEVALVDYNVINGIAPGTIVFADETNGLVVKCHKASYLKLMVLQNQTGYLSGVKLFQMGFRQGVRFTAAQQIQELTPLET